MCLLYILQNLKHIFLQRLTNFCCDLHVFIGALHDCGCTWHKIIFSVIRNQNIVTRFVTEFGLEQEMIQAQGTINKVILSVNNFLEPGNPGENDINRIGVASNLPSARPTQTTSSEVNAIGGSSVDFISSWLTNIPQAIGAASVAAIKFITPSAAAPGAATKIAADPSRPDQTFSELKPMVDVNQLAFGILGVAALGTVGYSLYAAKGAKKRRYQKRSAATNQEIDQDQLLMKIGKAILKGKVCL